MNRYLGLSGIFHIALVAGLFYLGAKNDFSPHKVIESLSFESFGGEKNAGAEAELKASTESTQQEVLPTEAKAATETKSEEKVAAKLPEKSGKMAVKKTAPVSKAAVTKSKTFKTSPIQTNEASDVSQKTEQEVQLDDSVVEEAITEVKQSETTEKESEVTKEEVKQEDDSEAIAATHEQEIQKQSDAEAKAEEEAARAKKIALLNDLRRQNAERDAQEAALAAAAAASSAKESSGQGAQTSGEGPQAGEEVRALSELKQVGGNPKPQYDNEDRMKNRSGTVVFQAFVQNDGSLKEFNLVESSGHRTLDSKTLKALKQWKFAAGQEGWIEIPFKWDLTGGAQEVSPLKSPFRTNRSAVTK